jgi:hypothetical protein
LSAPIPQSAFRNPHFSSGVWAGTAGTKPKQKIMASNRLSGDAAKLRISDCRLRILRSAIRDPQSAFFAVMRANKHHPTASHIGFQNLFLSKNSIIL